MLAMPPEALQDRVIIQPVSMGHEGNAGAAKYIIGVVSDAVNSDHPDIEDFEEGPVLPITKTDGLSPSKTYFMSLVNAKQGEDGVCARMHKHPLGDRLLTVFTGEDTRIIIASLLIPMVVKDPRLRNAPVLEYSTDEVVVDSDEMLPQAQTRYSVVIPPNSQFNMFIPQGMSHCFIADGSEAAVISFHPDEAAELKQTGQNSNMGSQTEFMEPEVRYNCPAGIGQV